jgi:hypothetical protein
MMQKLCVFKATIRDQMPCPCFADPKSTRGYCGPHEDIYLHDVAVAYKRKLRKDKHSATRWAESLGVSTKQLDTLIEGFGEYERAMLVEVQ